MIKLKSGGSPAARRLAGVILHACAALTFSLIVRAIYVDLLVPVMLLQYTGIRAYPDSEGATGLLIVVALLPVLWLPISMHRGSDLLELFLFYSVHLPTCVLMPIVSESGVESQFLFTLAMATALGTLRFRYAVPLLRVPRDDRLRSLFWPSLWLFCIVALGVFVASGHLSPSNLDFSNVYARREDLAQQRDTLGSAFFYLANWTGVTIAPFLMFVGLRTRRIATCLVGIFLAAASFAVSSSKANFIAVGAVIGGYYLLNWTRGRFLALSMALAFCLLGGLSAGLDLLIGEELPVVTWTVFHRTFSNNGFLSAVYLDFFFNQDPALYTDSFMRWFIYPVYAEPIAQQVAHSFTTVPDVHANAHLWADGYANLGSLGIAFSAFSLTLVLWLYDSVTRGKDQILAACALIVPSTMVANTSVHTALLSNGFGLVIAMMYLWDENPLSGHPKRRT